MCVLGILKIHLSLKNILSTITHTKMKRVTFLLLNYISYIFMLHKISKEIFDTAQDGGELSKSVKKIFLF